VRLLKPYGVSADVATATTLVETTLLSASLILPALLVACVVLIEGIQGFGMLNQWLLFMIGTATLIGIAIWQWKTAAFVDFRARGIQKTACFWDQAIQTRLSKYFGDWPAQRVIKRIQYLWSESMASLQTRPYAILLSLFMHFVFEALCLVMCFYALGQRLPLTILLLLYPLTIAINTLGAVPGGIGLAEVSLSAFYAQFGIAIEVAVAIALTYRLTSYWFPRAVGGLAWLWMEHTNRGLSMTENPL
jgi:uncharacterized protein (TIRG00374 family)